MIFSDLMVGDVVEFPRYHPWWERLAAFLCRRESPVMDIYIVTKVGEHLVEIEKQ